MVMGLGRTPKLAVTVALDEPIVNVVEGAVVLERLAPVPETDQPEKA
jgi:hypothetical protein